MFKLQLSGLSQVLKPAVGFRYGSRVGRLVSEEVTQKLRFSVVNRDLEQRQVYKSGQIGDQDPKMAAGAAESGLCEYL